MRICVERVGCSKLGRSLLLLLSAMLLSPTLSCSRDVVSLPDGEVCCERDEQGNPYDASNHHVPVEEMSHDEDVDMHSPPDLGRARPEEPARDMDADAGDMRLSIRGDMSTARDMGMPALSGGFEYCDCDHPDAICKFNRCYLPRDCEDLGCPDGFGACLAGELCDCDGEWGASECAPNCATMEDCPHNAFCGPGGKCVEQPGCTASGQCPLGMWCLDSVCVNPGNLPTGAQCEKRAQCASGSCSSRGCGMRCNLDSDCPAGEACTGNENLCVPGTYSCAIECPEGTNCRNNKCEGARCNWTGDCVVGDCQIDPEYATGNCLDNEQKCKPNEFRSRPEDVFCRIFLSCGEDEDCPGGYTCESDGWEGIPYHRNLCSRLL